jgi:hypothetical protein
MLNNGQGEGFCVDLGFMLPRSTYRRSRPGQNVDSQAVGIFYDSHNNRMKNSNSIFACHN